MSWVEWVFSGIGVAIPISLLGWYLNKRRSREAPRVEQRIRAGKNSVNLQIGRDVNVPPKSGVESAADK